jgi:hypothetical protein
VRTLTDDCTPAHRRRPIVERVTPSMGSCPGQQSCPSAAAQVSAPGRDSDILTTFVTTERMISSDTGRHTTTSDCRIVGTWRNVTTRHEQPSWVF